MLRIICILHVYNTFIYIYISITLQWEKISKSLFWTTQVLNMDNYKTDLVE